MSRTRSSIHRIRVSTGHHYINYPFGGNQTMQMYGNFDIAMTPDPRRLKPSSSIHVSVFLECLQVDDYLKRPLPQGCLT